MLLSYISHGSGYHLWDLQNRCSIKSRDVIFVENVFPYTSTLTPVPPESLPVEISWSSSSRPSVQPPPAAPTSSEPPPSVSSAPRRVFTTPVERRLQDSMHAPLNRSHDPLVPLPDSDEEILPDAPLPEIPLPPPVAATNSRRRMAVPQAPLPRRFTRTSKAPDRLGTWAKKSSEDVADEPKTWRQLLRSPNKHKWLKAVDEELASLVGTETWKLVPRPSKRKIIRSKWVFKVKKRPDGSILKLKARLVAMGYTQEKGIDYNEVFAPTTRLETLRLVISLLASKNWYGFQIDFKTAFLNSKLDTVIYMSQPPGMEDPEHPDWVCEVTGSLYGLKQSPRLWNRELHAEFLRLGLIQSKFDPTLYFMIKDGCLVCAIATHVDDLAVTGELDVINPLMDSLASKFKIGEKEELHHFLLLKITRDRPNRYAYLGQEHYINNLCDRFLNGSHTHVSTPTGLSFKDLRPRCDSEDCSPGPYSSLVGALLWAAQCTRPDISFLVHKLSQFLHNPSASHWDAAIRVLNYLVLTKSLQLRLDGPKTCCGYSDSDWAEDRVDRRSTSAYTFRAGDGSISWRSKKQPTVSLSSTEAEYKALSDSCKEALWL